MVISHVIQREQTFSYKFLLFLVLFLYHSQPPLEQTFLKQSTPLPFFGVFFHWFFPCPFTILLKWNMNLVMFKIELDLESDDIWTDFKLDKINSLFSRLGKDIDLFREVWGLIYDFKQNRMCLQEFCAVFGILTHCRRILYPTTQWGPVLRALIQSSYFTWYIF